MRCFMTGLLANGRALYTSDTEQLLERSRCRADRLRIGALLGLVLRGGKAVAGAAVDLILEGDLRGTQLLDQRSEERRVGKECRAVGRPTLAKKKRQRRSVGQ